MKIRLTFALSLALPVFTASPATAQNQTWIRQLGTSNADVAVAAALDGGTGLFVVGYTTGGLGGASSGGVDTWLAHSDGAGNQTWIRQFGTSGSDNVTAAAPDGLGGVFLTGYTDGSLGGTNLGQGDAWIAHYDSAGSQAWIRQFGTSASDTAQAAAPDGAGGVYLCGNTNGSLGGPSAGGPDAWVARYDFAGNQTWLRQFGTNNLDVPMAAATDGSGGLYVTGITEGSLGGPNSGNKDAWVSHYDAGGNQAWISQLGTNQEEWANSAAPDGLGGVYLSGTTKGNLGGPLWGWNDVWLARYDNAGIQIWIRQFGTSGAEYAYSTTPDEFGGVYVSGNTNGSLGGPNADPTGNTDDVWLALYDNAGNQTWTRQFGTSSYDESFGAASDGAGGVCLTGETSGSLGGPNAGGQDAWLAHYDGPFPLPTTYCTAKVNSPGCTPSIGWSGTPTISGATDDFYVTASNMLNRKPGIMLWSTLPAAHPFGGGTLCLAPPIVRTPGQASGGSLAPTIDCTGQYSFHFGHAYIQNYFLAAGQSIRAQYWSRDPGFAAPNNIGLTDGLSFTLQP